MLSEEPNLFLPQPLDRQLVDRFFSHPDFEAGILASDSRAASALERRRVLLDDPVHHLEVRFSHAAGKSPKTKLSVEEEIGFTFGCIASLPVKERQAMTGQLTERLAEWNSRYLFPTPLHDLLHLVSWHVLEVRGYLLWKRSQSELLFPQRAADTNFVAFRVVGGEPELVTEPKIAECPAWEAEIFEEDLRRVPKDGFRPGVDGAVSRQGKLFS